MLFLDGVYVEPCDGSIRFRWVKALASPKALHCASPGSLNGKLHPRGVSCHTTVRPSALGINSRIERTQAATPLGLGQRQAAGW
jgi:hypothetical protein